MSDTGGFRRAMLVMTASSMLVPVVGIVTAPILAQALGVAGRGEAAAVIAPNLLVVSVATLGLPEALTYHLAKRPHSSRVALWWASLFSAVLGAACLIGVFFAASFLSAGDADLADLMVLGTALAIPALFVNLLRGAASGRQMWTAVAMERITNSLLRLVVLAALALTGHLDVLSAVLVMTIAPIVAGAVYWKLALAPPLPPAEPGPQVHMASALLSFGSKIWLGAVASMLMARLSQLLVIPLSDATQLGILVVAITISDVPFIVAQTVRDVVFGADSARADPERLALTARLATLIALTGSLVLGGSLPFWISTLFGEGFDGAIGPTWLLLASSVISVPGLIAGAGLASAGRPGLRSVALIVALVTNLIGIVVLTPALGAVGAATAALMGSALSTAFGVLMVARLLSMPSAAFVLPRRSDIAVLVSEGMRVVRRVGPRRSRQPR
ncbi:Polysaccharide biosynthesis protein [Modestobacter italicus]|uniref:Polysaccharide biosynthesis protein n=1 Tax=Modestobacter italicus (strain DSM 44449 / CECT 9708 / BC 501) TaxID=2732864 RepID=I4ERC6_MODI5|nr:oligosaccharide flippase family protein [Modestobacter marinus]CCH85939.1 Polysaccharide biosynthesis protein [Modestobacter marinus]